jgi:hypothetical protein
MNHEGAMIYSEAASNQVADGIMLNHQESNYVEQTIEQMDGGLRRLSGSAELDKTTEDQTVEANNLPDVNFQLDEIGVNMDIMDKLDGVDNITNEEEGNGRLKYDYKRSGKWGKERLESTQKVKRALFVVEKVFGVEIDDASRVQIDRGFHRTENMVTGNLTLTKNQYYRVTIPELNAVLFVANHRDRDTFVFNKQQLDQYYQDNPDLREEDNLQFGQNMIRDLMTASGNTGGFLKGYGDEYQSSVEQGVGQQNLLQ